MLTAPSAEFTTAANAADREPKVRVDFLWTDPFVLSGNKVTSDDVNNFGDLGSTVVDDLLLHTVDTKLSTPHKYVINDGTLINDGTFYPVPGTVEEAAYNQVGWYTEDVSDSDGIFSEEPELTVKFAEARSIKKLIVVGEPTLEEYPVDFDVFIYDEGDVLLNPVTNFAGTSVETMLDFVSDDITTAKYMVLKLNQWSASGTIGKIVEFFGVLTSTLYGGDVVSMNILEETESEESYSPFGCMSCNEMKIELQNIEITVDGVDIENPYLPENDDSYLSSSITQNVRITPYIGFKLPDTSIEYVPMGVFWSTNWDTSESMFAASVTARDRLYILSKNYFQADEILESTNLKEIAEYVLNHAKVNIPLNDLSWSVDDSLESYTVDYAWLGKVTYFEALKKIASACIGRCYCNRDDVIVIESYSADQVSEDPDITIDHGDCFEKRREMKEVKNSIIVPVCPLAPEEEDGDIYSSDTIDVGALDTSIEQNIKWEDDAVYEFASVDITNTDVVMTLTSEEYFPWGANLIFTKISGTSGSFEYKITGKKLIPVVGIDNEIAEDTESQSKYDKQEYDLKENYLIQDSTVAASVADALLQSLKNNRRDIDITIQGNPCTEIGDIASIETYSKLSTYEEFRIIRNQFEINKYGLKLQVTAKNTIDFGS